jgi:hypothetical protein
MKQYRPITSIFAGIVIAAMPHEEKVCGSRIPSLDPGSNTTSQREAQEQKHRCPIASQLEGITIFFKPLMAKADSSICLRLDPASKDTCTRDSHDAKHSSPITSTPFPITA